MKKKSLYFLYIVLLYLSLHNFPIYGVGSKSIAYIFTLLLLVLGYKEYVAILKKIKIEVWMFLLILSYALFRTLAGGDFALLTKHIVAICDMIFTPITLFLISLKIGIKGENRYVRSFLIFGCIASVISLISFIYPSVQAYIKYTILNLQPDNQLYWNNYRGFGLSASLSSNYAYIQGTLFVLGCYYFRENKWILWFLPLLFLSTIFNARTGVIISIVGVFLYLLLNENVKYSVFVGIVGILFFVSLQDILRGLGAGNDAISWMLIAFNDFNEVVQSQDLTESNTGSILLGRMWVLPNTDLEWLFGKGYSLHRHLVDDTSDVGWILQLNYGGIIYMIILYLLILYMFYRLIIIKRYFFALFFIFIFAIVNTKSSFLPNCDEFRMLMMLYIYYIAYDKLNKKMKNKYMHYE